jgi:dephospho-CoA kinase
MLKIGLTGGIGSGKSTVAQVFEMLGIPVFYADDEAKKIYDENEELKNLVIKHFGNESYTAGKLNRGFISSVVFNDKEKLDLLNSLIHPATMKQGEEWMKKQTSPYAIHEAALIFEAKVNTKLDYVIGVSAPEELRIERAMKRNNASRADVSKRISLQMNEEEKLKGCDFVLVNDEQQLLIPQVLALHDKLIALANV